ncbi:hypothetical protein EON64_02165 [archaeon]|nr:MAG: hypothetical protein EON64_02165 [archaeon]
MTHDGSVLSWLKVMPRYKINREGEPLSNSTEILLKVAERANEYLHCADRPPPKGKHREVNSSLDSPTGWKVSIYQTSEELATSSLLLSGQLVYIRDPESQSMLAPLAKKLDVNVTVPNTTSSSRVMSPTIEQNFFESPWNAPHKLRVRSEDAGDSGASDVDDLSESSWDEYVREHGHVGFLGIREDMINTDALWMMESKSIVKAGVVRFKTEKVQFRHLNTGLYLTLVQPYSDTDHFLLSLESKADEKKTMFSIHELHSANELLSNGKAVQIRHGYYGSYLERGPYNDSQKVHPAVVTRLKSRAVSLILNRYVQKEKVLIKKVSATGDEALDVYFSKAACHHLTRFARALAVPVVLSQDVSTIFPRIDKQEAQQFSSLMARIMIFVRGYPIRTKMRPEELSKFKGGKHIVLRRQNMLREVGVLQIIMTMIKALQPLSNLLAQDMSTMRLGKSAFIEMGRGVLTECLQLLFDTIRKNAANQLYIADHLIIILEHVSSDQLASKVAQELLSSNRELQETKIGKREVAVFTEKVQETPMNAMYLQLLRTCCSCAVSSRSEYS